VINDPEQALVQQEIINITSWVERGGALLVWAEDMYHNNITSLNELLEVFGVQLDNVTKQPGSVEYVLTEQDKQSTLLRDTAIDQITFKDPIQIARTDGSTKATNIEIMCNSSVATAEYGKGRVLVVGDNDLFKDRGLNFDNNSAFAERALTYALTHYYDMNVTGNRDVIKMYEQGYVTADIMNLDDLDAAGLTEKGFLFVSAFFLENGSMINASIYGMGLPALPMFFVDGSTYATSLDTSWHPAEMDYYVILIADHPGVAQEIFYVRFQVVAGAPPPAVQRFNPSDPGYPHFIDWIGIGSVVTMGLILWVYDLEKYRSRLKITQLKGDYLNQAKTRINEGKTLINLMKRGLEHESDEIEALRFILSKRKTLLRYLKHLRKFGDSVGEHY
jgi:hypothetical protein